MHGGATGRCVDGKSATHAPGNAGLTTAAVAVDRSANGSGQPHDRAGHAVASGRGDSTGGSTWPGSGFGATDHRRGRGAGGYILFGGGVGGLGGNLSWQGRKRGAEPKQSLCERQQIPTPSSEPSRARRGRQERLSFSDCVPPSDAPPRL